MNRHFDFIHLHIYVSPKKSDSIQSTELRYHLVLGLWRQGSHSTKENRSSASAQTLFETSWKDFGLGIRLTVILEADTLRFGVSAAVFRRWGREWCQ